MSFAVPKNRRDVTVRENSGKKIEGAIFLDFYPEEQSIHHKMLAFLENENPFFPLLLKESNETEFFHKHNVRMIELEYGEDEEQIHQALSLMHTESITAVFMDESAISGLLLAEVPDAKARLSDCLNLPHAFVGVRVDNRIHYINKQTLQKVMYAGRK